MKVVSWNCNGALRKKLKEITSWNADIYVIQECEDPNQSKDEDYKSWADNHLWVGDNKNKGLGIFAKTDILLTPLNWSNQYEDHQVKYFLPCLIENHFQLLATWAHHNNSPTFGYIGQVWKYLNINADKFDKIIIAGDLNSNAIWDKWDRWWNHSDVVKHLKKKGITSLYHHFTNEIQGEESKPTLFLQKNPEKPYHIDYFFASEEILKQTEKISIGVIDDWLKVSDHMPLMMETSF
ncbi:endonuclease/exonuclease/phosphatase family protein [Reichenbachiella ulvae]|uniref:Endonuclease/exonuclease/phosphatase family protein n=1 Tax=Reichenbachiella ulvae TaxID=2980104 RepID=A0ABT3CP68_9BACT|nr:endonuclease/exonuclease/phosphatase family protein [Reichenbachiella ulvae]MCV9385324.1 endonuclease/exonuclease/phosphatase family protein [Reichenbachiella ulvae]